MHFLSIILFILREYIDVVRFANIPLKSVCNENVVSISADIECDLSI